MSQQLTESNTRQQRTDQQEHPAHKGKGVSRVGWFAKNFPQFFTAKVIANRKTPLKITTVKPAKPNRVTLKRKLGRKQTGFIQLEKMSDDTMKFSCDKTEDEWTIESTLLITMAVTPKINHVSDWAGIRISGKKDLVVNRLQLLTALRFFEVLARK